MPGASTPVRCSSKTRSHTEIDRFFTGLEYLPPYEGASPGLSYVDVWGSNKGSIIDPSHTCIPAGVALKN